MILMFKHAFLVIFSILPTCLRASHYQETLFGAVGAGNYSYYMLTNPGTVLLFLSSIEGDADLYVSSRNLKPTFDVENHELQSTTCGVEQIKVSSQYDRPLSIAVYGHPSHDVSFYELKIDVFDPPEETDIFPVGEEETDFYPAEEEESKKSKSTNKPTSTPNFSERGNKQSEEQSIFWTLFLRILNVLLDVLVD